MKKTGKSKVRRINNMKNIFDIYENHTIIEKTEEYCMKRIHYQLELTNLFIYLKNNLKKVKI